MGLHIFQYLREKFAVCLLFDGFDDRRMGGRRCTHHVAADQLDQQLFQIETDQLFSGEVNVLAGKKFHALKKGDIIFHRPNEFHDVNSNGLIAPNLVVMSFSCDSPVMSFFEEKVLQISEPERLLLAQIIQEAKYVG